MSRTCYAWGPDRLFISETLAEADPRNPGSYILPANATFNAPPSAPGKLARWSGNLWMLVDIPSPVPPPAAPLDPAARSRAAGIVDARDAAAAISRMFGMAEAQGEVIQSSWRAYLAALESIAATPSGQEPAGMPGAPADPVSLPREQEA